MKFTPGEYTGSCFEAGVYQDLRFNLNANLNEDRAFIAAWSRYFGI